MNRTKFYKTVSHAGVREIDFLDHNLTKLTVSREPSYYRLSSIDRKRPDIISYKNYGIVGYWWVICVVNGIEDPFFETTIGRVVAIPNVLDVYTFYKNYKMK